LLVVTGYSAGNPNEPDDRSDAANHECSDSEILLSARSLRHFLLTHCLVGLLTFTFLGSHRSRRLSVRCHGEGTTTGARLKSEISAADIQLTIRYWKEHGGTVTRLANWVGRLLCAAGLTAWLGWLGWRVSSPPNGPVGLAALVLELVAFASALVVTAGLWDSSSARDSAENLRSGCESAATRALPELMTDVLGVSSTVLESRSRLGDDDTGEVAWARHGLVLLGANGSSGRDANAEHVATSDASGLVEPADSGNGRRSFPSLEEAAWSVVATDGLRRMLFVALLVVVLFSGQAPFEVPPWQVASLLVGALALLSVGHWLLSAGLVRPGSRTIWSMASVGAGFGDGTSRTGLPIRWMATMATMVVLNLSISLRGLSDRWTHGLGVMSHDERVAAMSAAFGLVMAGFMALRTLEQPNLGFYGATRRLEEGSARRLALGATVGVALLGFVAGILPAAGPA
jgi:hypothetical protein